jgi:transglutaminase-like putative cysteine protease
MRGLALRDRTHPTVQQAANQLGGPAGIEDFFRAAWRIVPDPDYVEFISSPVRQLALYSERGFLSGDCDDAATLAACLLSAIGLPCVLVAIRLHGYTEFSHVFARTAELDIDPIVPATSLPITNYAETLEVPV